MYQINNTIRLNRSGVGSDDGFQSGGKSRESQRFQRVSVLPLQNRSFYLRLLILSFFSICLLTFLSCSNLADGAASSDGTTSGGELSNQTIIFTGRISSDGAFPLEIASASVTNASQQNLGSAAFPSLSPSTGYSYFVEATDENGNSVPSEKITVNQTSKTFTVPLAAGKTWTITCGVKKTVTSGGSGTTSVQTVVLQDSYPDFTPSAANPVLNNQIFNLQHVGSGNGSINLTLHADSSIDHVVISCSDSAWQNAISVSSILFTDGSTTFEASDVPAGQYEVVMKFYTSSDVIKYTTIQTINVVPNMSTETWVAGDGGSGVISDTGAFNVSSSIISAANNREIYYVGQTAAATSKNITPSNSNDGSAYSPLASITGACTYIAANGKPGVHYKIYVEGTVTGHNEISNTITEDNAASITIEGYRGLDSTGLPQDVLDGGFTTDVIQGVVLMLSTPVPVTIKNLKITGGFPRSGGVAGGIYIWNTPTTLENCVITGNKTYGMGETTEYCAGVRIAPLVTSFTLKGKNIIKDNFKVGDDGIPYPANLYVGNSSKKIKISGDITGSEIGINVPYSGTSVPTAANPKVFTENYRYGTTNTALPGTIFTAENGYAITRITSGTNAGEAAFAVSSGGMYSYEDFTFGFAAKESAEAGAANVTQIFPGEARTVYIMPASLKRKESDGSDTDLYYNSTDKKLYLASDHSVKACGDNALEITAALYNGGYKVCDMTTAACEGGRSVEIPYQSLPGTYVLKVYFSYLGATKEKTINLACTTDGVAYGLSQLAALPAGGGSLALTGTLSADDFTALNTAIKARQTASSSFRVDLDLSAVTELTQIPAEAFRDNDALRTVVLPEGITSIGEMAFYDCIALTTINLPDGLTEIGDSAFDACFNLTGVTISDTITSIGGHAFEQCKLTSVVLPEGLTTVGNGAFGHMNTLQTITIPSTLTIIPIECFKFSHITTVNIPEGVEKIYYWAFWGCSELISINIPSTIDYIHAQAFDKNKKLEAINVAETNTVYKSIDGVVYKYNDDGSLSFALYPNGKGTSYVISADANVTSIETSFCYWQNENNDLVELTIPVSVTNIKSEAFKSCNNLTTLNYSGTMVQWNAITKASNWQGGSSTSSYRLAATVVHCSDGDVSIE